jgi:transposase InsO family protein
VLDAYSRRIVGRSMRDDLKSRARRRRARNAVTRRKPPAGVVHHSDRGSQYIALAFGTTLHESGLIASMGRRGDAYDNAACESVISTSAIPAKPLQTTWFRARCGGCAPVFAPVRPRKR